MNGLTALRSRLAVWMLIEISVGSFFAGFASKVTDEPIRTILLVPLAVIGVVTIVFILRAAKRLHLAMRDASGSEEER